MSQADASKPDQIETAWFGDLPDRWDTERAKGLFKLARREVLNTDETVTCFRDGQVTLRKNRRTTGFTEAIHFGGYQGVEPGDLVIHQMDAFAGAVGVSDSRGRCTPAYAVCAPRNGAIPAYYARVLRVMAQRGWIAALAKGIRERSTDFRFATFGRQWVPVPPVAEQILIARYLDHAELQINLAVQSKLRMIALLQERMQLATLSSITAGSGPARTDDRVDWLGPFPSHWDVVRLGSVLTERREMNSNGHVEQVLSLVRKRGVIRYEDKGNIGNKKSENISRYKVVRPGDIVLNSMNVIIGSVGISKYLGCLSPVYYVLHPRDPQASPEFFNAMFQVQRFHASLIRFGKGILAHRMRISMLDLKTVMLPLPPIQEQRDVAARVQMATDAIQVAVLSLQQDVDLLREYQTRLIADVVTGKRDIRSEAQAMADVDQAELASVKAAASSEDVSEESEDGD